jgi:hypothetical protein
MSRRSPQRGSRASYRNSRAGRIASMRQMLEQEQHPRLQMLIIVMLTGLAGLLASVLLLAAGVTAMALRYVLALCIAYAVFLFILWLWLRWGGEGVDVTVSPSSGGRDAAEGSFSGKGGSFDGGGASGDYDAPSALGELDDKASGAFDGMDGVDVDVGDAGIPLLVLGLLAALLFCGVFVICFVVYSAPTLIAELLVDGVLSASLYRRLRGIDQHHWLQTALRRTMWPFIATAVSVVVVGFALTLYTPGAHTLGEAISAHVRKR